MDDLKIFLGATVADAAARPLHWVYDPKKLKNYIKGNKDVAFFKKNKSPYYSIETGKVSGYNDIGQVMFQTIITSKKKSDILNNFKKNIVKHFGPGSNYWKSLKERKKYKKIKKWEKPLQGPWIHQNFIETIQNIKSNKKNTGGTKVNESDGFCAALPYYFLVSKEDKEVKKVIRSVANSNFNEVYGLARLKIIDLASKGERKPVQKFIKINKKNRYFKEVIFNLKKVLKLMKHDHISTCKKLGKACSDPGNFLSATHCIISSSNYVSAINKTIKAGGCNASRCNYIGAFFAAHKNRNIPLEWIKKTIPAQKILEYF